VKPRGGGPNDFLAGGGRNLKLSHCVSYSCEFMYTPPTPTRHSSILSRASDVYPFATSSRVTTVLVEELKTENVNIQSSWLQNWKLGHDCRRVSTHRWTRLNSAVESRRRRRCALGLSRPSANLRRRLFCSVLSLISFFAFFQRLISDVARSIVTIGIRYTLARVRG